MPAKVTASANTDARTGCLRLIVNGIRLGWDRVKAGCGRLR